jgi:hypothetical protein
VLFLTARAFDLVLLLRGKGWMPREYKEGEREKENSFKKYR